ncbi:hypothetical protein RKE25_11965 [Dyella sp. BiH032]|nr:hypothetical protein [Dyella sp. BiH032]WNL44145.1 hypothetical protein RKE25_11965 [Dyella sp. BiH032]
MAEALTKSAGARQESRGSASKAQNKGPPRGWKTADKATNAH